MAKPDGAGITGGEQFILATIAAVPNRADRMDHMRGRQPITFSDLGAPGLATAERAAFFKQRPPCGPMDRAIHAATAEQAKSWRR